MKPSLIPTSGEVWETDFQNPSTLWMVPDGECRLLIESKKSKTIGCALVYHTINFTYFELKEEVLHAVPHTGIWECVDLYPVSTTQTNRLDMSVDNGPNVKHVLKESGDDNKHDWYSIENLDRGNDKWYPDQLEKDLGIGLRYDYGKLYASKTFFDLSKNMRVLWGFVGETDPPKHDISKG